jgi:thiamine biosynthesis lipoprotein
VNGLAAASGRALGTWRRVVVTDPSRLHRAEFAVDEVVAQVDAACSRFRDDSELSRLNAAAGHPTRVSALLAQALAVALRGARLSDGAVDPTVGSAVKSAGYSADFGDVAHVSGPIRLVVRRVPGWRRIALDEAARTATVPAGVELDLGSTAKALAADLAAAAARRAMGAGGVLVSLGGDIAVAGEPPVGGWHIQVAEDSGASLGPDAETVSIDTGGLATSSTTVRSWTRGATTLHHIMDPATGQPTAGPWRTATVCAGDCVDANIAATAAIVMGRGAREWLETRGLPARLVDQGGAVTFVGRWPRPSRPSR